MGCMNTTTQRPGTVSITNGVTHTGDNAAHFEAALTACAELILEDPEWTVQVVLAAIVAEHEINRGVDIRRVRKTLGAALSADLLGR